MLSDDLITALGATGAKLTPQASLTRKAYWKCGGPAELLVEVKSLGQLRGVLRVVARVTVLGRGSNALIHDAGIPGVVLMLKGELAALEIADDHAWVGAGMKLNALLNRLDQAGMAGAEPFSGVPGTMGGAVVMNAGTRLGEAKERIQSVEMVVPGGEVLTWTAEECGFSYRHSNLPVGAVVSRVKVALFPDPDGSRMTQREAFLVRRKATQPLDKPSCGSTFTNPEGDSAGRLIDACGLKGHKVGGAQISELHANFFLNDGGASSEDLRQLIVHARRVVYQQTGTLLRPEVKLLGDWGPDPLSIE
ncbi:MAG: UDP-N-acetylmuramate dehydrogenase [Cognaticolwellia sp.]|jgi:UDP-N-acetylmuramate dehydrogenase